MRGRRILLNFKRCQGTWIYCNYPERLPVAALGDSGLGNKYLNRVFVEGASKLFASYINSTGGDIFFGVLFHNPGNAPARVILQGFGHRHSGTYTDWCDVQGGVWRDFFTPGSEEALAVPPEGSAWIFERRCRYVFQHRPGPANGSAWECLVYVYRSRGSIDGTATCFPWKPGDKQYRGAGDSYTIETSLGLHLSRMPCHYYTCRCGNNPNEITPIYDSAPAPGAAAPVRTGTSATGDCTTFFMLWL